MNVPFQQGFEGRATVESMPTGHKKKKRKEETRRDATQGFGGGAPVETVPTGTKKEKQETVSLF